MMFPSLPDDAGVFNALTIDPEKGRLLAAYHQALLRGDSPIPVRDRELIAAYVSGLNSCGYCHSTHLETAVAFGADRDLVRALIADPALAATPDRLRPLLAYARKLTLDHNNMVQADADAVYAAGWSERALHDAILVTAMFNFMNRFVHGHGISANAMLCRERGAYLHDNGYQFPR